MLKIIFSKNPNCSGHGMALFFLWWGGICGVIAFLLSPFAISALHSLTKNLTSEEKEKAKTRIKRILKLLIGGTIFLAIIYWGIISRFLKYSLQNSFEGFVMYFLLPILALVFGYLVTYFLFCSEDFSQESLFTKFVFGFLTFIISASIFFVISELAFNSLFETSH